MNPEEKLEKLKNIIRQLASVAVAYSGGVDSSFLLSVAREVLRNNVIAVTAQSSVCSERERRDAAVFTGDLNVRYVIIEFDPLDIKGFSDNPPDRCYYCKRELLSKVSEVAHGNNIRHVVEGSNIDDLGDYRPGAQAVAESEVRSPLQEAGLTKEDIRILSRKMNLPTWDKPAAACLASRIPYGQKINADKLAAIDRAEQFLIDQGFRQVRVRHHGNIARIEVSAEERSKFFDADLADRIHDKFQRLGFAYTALDLKGYRTGSLNEILNTPHNKTR